MPFVSRLTITLEQHLLPGNHKDLMHRFLQYWLFLSDWIFLEYEDVSVFRYPTVLALKGFGVSVNKGSSSVFTEKDCAKVDVIYSVFSDIYLKNQKLGHFHR